MMPVPRRLIAPAIVIVLTFAVWALGLLDHLTWAGLARDRAGLVAWVTDHPLLAPCFFVIFYTVSVTLSLPQAGLMTMTGGLLFGILAGGAMAVAGATLGAVFLFLIARSAFGDPLARRGGAALGKLREELRRDGFSYLLSIRLVPVVPFWLVNLAAALCGMRLRHYVAATLIGIMPMTFVLASIGAGLGDVLAKGERPNLGIIFSWPILGPLVALAVASLTPVIWRKLRASNG